MCVDFLHELDNELVKLNDPITAQITAVRRLRDHLAVDRVGIATVTNGAVAVAREAGPISALPPPFADPRAVDELTNGRVWVGNDWLGTALAVPFASPRAGCALFAYAASHREWTVAERQLVHQVALRLRVAVECERMADELRANEAKYRALFESMVDGLAIGELVRAPDGTCSEVRRLEENAAFGRMVAPSMPWHNWLTAFQRVVDQQTTERFHAAIRVGQSVAVTAFPIGGQRFGLLVDDQSGRQPTDDMRTRDRHHAFLLALNDQLRALTDPDAVVTVATRMLGEHLAADRVVYGEVVGDDAILRAEYTSHHTTPLPPETRRVHKFRNVFQRLAVRYARGEVIGIDDATTDPRLLDDERELLARVDSRASCRVQLAESGHPVAVLGVHCKAPRQWSDLELVLVRDAGERAWAAVARCRAEAALRASAAALEDADRRKNEFLATLAHELRNPLAPLRNGLTLARNPTDPATLARTLDMMERQLAHLVRLVDDLLDIGRISSGKLELRREPISLRDVIASSIELARPQIVAHDHTLIVDSKPTLYVNGDFERLCQVFTNLLSNAAKYTPPGGRIVVSCASEGNAMAVVRVTDTGIGIAHDDLARVFDMFAQIRVRDSGKSTGLGIGLSLVRSLVERHGGTVEATSPGLGHGSTLVVRLPTCERPIRTVTQELAPVSADTLRILVVDDNVDAAVTLGELLEFEGHRAVVAHDGAAAIALARDQPFDLVLMDIGLPGMDGVTAAQQIRALPDRAGTHIVAVTGWGGDDDRSRTRAAGFDAHLVKPVDFEQLRSILAKCRARSSRSARVV